MPSFIPALRFHFLTPLYDICARLLFGATLKKIVGFINPKPGEKILDLGCGPGNLILEINRRQKEAEVTGIDIDPAILAIARKKLKRAGSNIKLMEASAAAVPLKEPFDTIVSTLVIHHLEGVNRGRMLSEAYRLLKPGGKFFLYDFAPPRNVFLRIVAKIFRCFEDIDDGISGRYPELLRQAGFCEIKSIFKRRLFELLEARRL